LSFRASLIATLHKVRDERKGPGQTEAGYAAKQSSLEISWQRNFE
jgi:hypothetical protein